jgi:hypothetical protein
MKNCRFCNKPMLPVIDIITESDSTVEHCMWQCHACPATVTQSYDEDWFSLLAFWNGHWYEVMQFYVLRPDDTKELPLLSIYRYTTYLNDSDQPCLKSEFVKEWNMDGKITPENIQHKLATLLVFS